MIRKIGLILIFLSSLYLLTVYLGKRNIINEEAEKVQEFMEAEKNDDEFVEITPESIRLRKQILNTEQRKKVDAKNK